MQIFGKVIHLLPRREFNGKNGINHSQDFVIEYTMGQFAKKIAFTLTGDDNIKNFVPVLTKDAWVDVDFDVESREYNGKWFTNARAFNVKLHVFQQQAPQPSAQAVPQQAQPAAAANTSQTDALDESDNGQLPF